MAERKTNAVTQKSAEEKVKGMTPDENTDFLAHALAPFGEAATDLLDPVAIEERVKAYMASCAARNMKPNPPGLAAWLGVSQDEFRAWLAGMGSLENRQLASRVHQMLHQLYADYSLSGKLSPQLAMFFGQNWFGYTQKNTMELQQAAPKKADLDALAAEAAALPDGNVVDASFVEIESAGKKQQSKKTKRGTIVVTAIEPGKPMNREV